MTATPQRTVIVDHLDVFALGPGGGNPCPIVLDADHLAAGQMQAIAAHYGQESGFVVRDDDGGLRFRFFVPRHEMAMCVHATVAAVTVLAAAGRGLNGTATIRTDSGECHVTCSTDDPPLVSVEQQAPHFGAVLEATDELARALGVPREAVDDRMPVQPVSVSRAKLIVGMRTAADVHRCVPDLERLWTLCRRLQVTGAYPYAPYGADGADGAMHVVARQFPVDAGFAEDPATGVAAGALAAYLAQQHRPQQPGWLHVVIDQGEAMGRPSRLRARAFTDASGVSRSTVEGTATMRARHELDLAHLDSAIVAGELR